jgi:2-polyprenyl-6-methoxyphenol hydroxylase-like FAD-dependent oxidoreductase
LGYDAPEEERVDVGIRYASAYFPRDARTEGLPMAAICQATADLPRPAVMIAQEPDAHGQARWVVGTGGYAGDHPEATLEGMRLRARQVGCEEIVRVTHELQPIGEVMRYHFPFSQRRRYERLRRFPARFLIMGDALTSFNPIYGQGMTTAACEALALDDALAGSVHGAYRRFFAAASRVIDTPWQLAVGGDLAIPAVQGKRSAQVRVVNGYLRWVHAAAERDEQVTYAFARVVHLLTAPQSLFAPAVLARVLWRRLRDGAPGSNARTTTGRISERSLAREPDSSRASPSRPFV